MRDDENLETAEVPAGSAGDSGGWTTAQRLTLVATGLGLFMIFLDALIVNVALPDIQKAFGVGESGLQWVVTAYSIGMAVFMMTSATLADLHGRRRLYIIGIIVFALGSVASGLAPNTAVLTTARCIQGLAAATVNVTSLALVSSTFSDPTDRAKAIGIWTAIASVATAVGPTIGGILTEEIGWRSIFLVNVPVAIVALILTAKFVSESKDPRERNLDLLGQGLFIVAIGALAYAVIQGQTAGWTSPLILGLLTIGSVSLALFVWHEFRARTPMMDVRLFGNQIYSLAIITIFFAFFCGYGMLLVVTQYFQNVRSYSPIEAGLLLLPFAVALVILSPLVGRIIARTGNRPLIMSGQAILIVGLSAIAIGMDFGNIVVMVGLGLVGVGMALLVTPITALAMDSVPEDRAGMASGIMSSQRALGSTVGYAVLGSILAIWLGATLNDSLATAIPNASQRDDVTTQIIDEATPSAYVAEVGPGRPITSADPAEENEILDAADTDFIQGIQLALGIAAGLSFVVLLFDAVGFRKRDEDEEPAEAQAG